MMKVANDFDLLQEGKLTVLSIIHFKKKKFDDF